MITLYFGECAVFWRVCSDLVCTSTGRTSLKISFFKTTNPRYEYRKHYYRPPPASRSNRSRRAIFALANLASLSVRYAFCFSHSGPHAWYSFLQVASRSSSAFGSASCFFGAGLRNQRGFVRGGGTSSSASKPWPPGSIAALVGEYWRTTRCVRQAPCKGGRP